MTSRTAPLKTKKDANINQKKTNRVFPRELFKFKYLRFKCRDSAKTIDFYKSCGMNLDFDGELVSFKHITQQNQQKNAAGKPTSATMESNHLKKAQSGDEEEKEEKEEYLGGPLGRVFGLSYPPTGNGVAALLNRIQLVFEEDREVTLDSKLKAQKGKQTDDTDSDEPVTKKTEKKKRRYEYLVIYVHFMGRLLKKLSSKGFDIMLDITQFDNNIKMSIVKDPNNIEVRLIEMPDSYMNEGSHQKQWFGRLGYYTIPTSMADKTVMLYESLFQIRVPKPMLPPKTKDAASAAEVVETTTPTNIRKLGPAQMVKMAMTKGSGFRTVDMDEMVVGLMNSVFFWMGNDMRTANCCLCFTEVVNADTGEAVTSYEKEVSPLVAIGILTKYDLLFEIGFEVPNLDAAYTKLKHETKDTLSWDPFRYRMSKSGIYARFADSINGINLDLLCSKLEPTVAAGKGKDRQNNAKIALLRKEPDVVKDYTPYVIDLNHLKGHARILSEGAIKFVKGYGWELRKDGTPDDSKSRRDKDMRPLPLFRDGQEGNQAGSMEDLDLTPVPRKIKPLTRLGHKDSGRQILEIFIKREKSKSI